MIAILSPSKTMNEFVVSKETLTKPFFLKEAKLISNYLVRLSKPELAALMKLSDKLSEQTWERIQTFQKRRNKESYPALFSYTGEVYAGLHHQPMESSDIQYAQTNLRILSGLYGVLKPLDAILPYRLEMATRLSIGNDNNLNAFWRKRITDNINRSISNSQSQFLANLASDEYTKAVNLKQITVPVIDFDFLEMKDGIRKFISFNAKRARGLMAAFIIRNRIHQPEDLEGFTTEGYTYDRENSTDSRYVFIRT